MTLLQDVLRAQTETLEQRLANTSLDDHEEDSEDEWVNVVSPIGTPVHSAPSSRCPSRPSSPTPTTTRLPSRSLRIHHSRDPLRILPTELSQRIFSLLSIKDLATCALVCRKWSRSQTLNYVWFQHYRKENFPESSLRPGKWTKRESKQNWRTSYMQTTTNRYESAASLQAGHRSGRSSPSSSGDRTPKELQEEKWRLESETTLSKNEMRAIYKELGGRKARSKVKFRDRGGWLQEEEM